MQRIGLKTYTPVAIGSGTTLSPYGDFVLDSQNQKLFILDQDKIKELLAGQDQLMDEYVKGVADGMDNTKSNFDLKSFITNRLNTSVKEVSKNILNTSSTVKGKIKLNEIVKNAGVQPYFPGSSIKGAIKTALLYYWLSKEKEGQNWLKNFLYNLENEEKRKKKEKELENILKFYTKKEHVEEEKLAFSDSIFLTDSSIKVYQSKRLHLEEKPGGIPQVWEAIDINNDLEVYLNNGKFSLEYIFTAIRHFSFDANDRMFSLLDEFGDNIDPKIYDPLFDFYKDIEERLKNGEILFRLGFGKGYFFNSVGMAVFNFEGGKYFKDFLKKYGHKKIKSSKHFPITQLIETSKGMPLGWVILNNKS